VKTVRREAEAINFNGLAIIAIDHGGPWLKDIHTRENGTTRFHACSGRNLSKQRLRQDMISSTLTPDRHHASQGQIINIDTVVARTLSLLFTPKIFGENMDLTVSLMKWALKKFHGGLADMKSFTLSEAAEEGPGRK